MNWRGLGMLVISVSLLRADGPPVTIVGPDSAPTPVPAAPTPPPSGAPSISIVAPQAAPLPPGTKPVQLQFIAPDTVQEDLVGHVKSVDEKSSDETMHSTRFDQNGCYTEEAKTKNGTVTEHRRWIYDTQGNLSSIQVLIDPEQTGAICTNEYDAAHLRVTQTIKMPDNTATTRVTSYDRFGKEHEVIERDGAQQTQRTVLTRDARGHETLVEFHGSDDALQMTLKITWNPSGTEEGKTFNKSSDKEGDSVEYAYTYPSLDDHGNWLMRVEHVSVQHGLQAVREEDIATRRTIEYY